MLETIVELIRTHMPLNRAIALFSPILVAAGAAVGTWLADHLPLVADQINGKQVGAVFVALVATGLTSVYKWLDERGKQLQREHDLEHGKMPTAEEIAAALKDQTDAPEDESKSE